MQKTISSALSRKPHLSPSALEFLSGELIGEKARVIKASGKDFQGIEGIIVDESRNTFVLDTAKGRKRLSKAQCVFFFPSAGVTADGRILVSRPEDRTRKLARLGSKKN